MKEEIQQAFTAIKSGNEDRARVLLAQMLKDDPEYVPGWVLLSKLAPNNLQKAAFLEKILTLDPDHAYARQEMEVLGAGAASTPEAGPAEVEIEELFEEELGAAARAPVVAPPEVRILEDQGEAEGAVPEFEFEDLDAGFTFDDAVPELVVTEPVDVTGGRQMPISAEPYDFDAQAQGESLPPWLAEDEELLAAEAGGDEPGEADRMPPEPELPDWLKVENELSALAPAGGKVRVSEEAPAIAGERSVPARRAAPAPASGPPAWLINGLIVVLIIVFLLLVYFGIRLFT